MATDALASLSPTHRAFIELMHKVIDAERDLEDAQFELQEVTNQSWALETDIRREVESHTHGLFTYEPQGIALLSEGRGDFSLGLFHVEENESGDTLIPATIAPLRED